jgi:hypothetical protein
MNPAHEVMKKSEQVSQVALDYLSWAARELVGSLEQEDKEKQPLSFEEMGSRLRQALRILQGGEGTTHSNGE